MYYCALSLGVLQHTLPRFLVTCAIWCVLEYSFRELLYVDSNVNSIIMPEVSEEEIASVILSINNSAPGYDDMPASVMKKCVHDYITPLTYLVNSKVFPIFKAGDEQLITNYRPISVLNFFF